MVPDDLARLKQKLEDVIVFGESEARVALVGWSAAAFELAVLPVFLTGAASLVGIFAPRFGGTVRPLEELSAAQPDIVVITEDAGKEPLLEAVAVLVPPTTKVLVGGYAHLEFRDETFDRVRRNLLIPSFANGYPHCLVHIYQCLQNAHRMGIQGSVAEFGMFKGGTTMMISRFIEEIGADWKVYGFDTFDGFPPRRSPLDMYDHRDCVFLDGDLVRAMFAGRNVEVIEGDVVETIHRLAAEDLVLSFVDTDNYTSARAIRAGRNCLDSLSRTISGSSAGYRHAMPFVGLTQGGRSPTGERPTNGGKIYAAAASGRLSKYAWSGVCPPCLECGLCPL